VLFRPPSWRPGHFLCLARESNQREANPGGTPALCAGALRAAGVLPTGHPWPAAKAARSIAPPRAGARA
jgi:hypothetical protein